MLQHDVQGYCGEAPSCELVITDALQCAARAHDVEAAAQNGSAPSRIPASSSAHDPYDRASDYGGSSHVHSSLSSVSEAWTEHHHGPPLSQLLQAFTSAGSDWKVCPEEQAALCVILTVCKLLPSWKPPQVLILQTPRAWALSVSQQSAHMCSHATMLFTILVSTASPCKSVINESFTATSNC